MEEEDFQSLLWKDENMETKGYSIWTIYPRQDGDPSEASLTEAIKKAIGMDMLYGPIENSGTRPAIYWEERDDYEGIFESFMEKGLDMDGMDGIIRSSLRKDKNEVLHQPLRLVRFLSNQANLGPKKAHPNPNSVSIFRPFGGDVGYKNGMFKVYPCSHPLQTKEEVLDSCRPTEIHLAANQILIILGSAWVELSTKGGGLVMWKGCSTRIVGKLDSGEHVLPFMKPPEEESSD
ncbi:hypothetical protein CNMCM5793_003677 [Aspergillus hiratsukae]|uniref:Uncharacterized protein n=1 Tax=Aspergillus hiratsukae TaxID=1194566 RepID=A0A8H6PEL1_9EURO|nr:hypothetical protein CNMCM5793_003677 [Aspergillus hiratsukae]KAF7169790.1 hypothetical protein CNMCM6106_004709 [Aspergillus hiratsukae]